MNSTAMQSARDPVQVEYSASLEAGAADKAALFEPWIQASKGDWIVDMGTGPGGVATRLARAFSEQHLLAVDLDEAMIQTALERHRAGNQIVEFAVGDARQRQDVQAATWILSSVLHEVAAQGGLTAVAKALEIAAFCLRPGGRLLLRDFVSPRDPRRRVLLYHDRADIRPGRSFSDLVDQSRYPIRFHGCQVGFKHVTYETDLAGAYEFLFRKDCGGAWRSELRQRYGFWTYEQCRDLVQRCGLGIAFSSVRSNTWVLRHRLEGKVRLRDAQTGEPLAAPVDQVFLVADKSSATA